MAKVQWGIYREANLPESLDTFVAWGLGKLLDEGVSIPYKFEVAVRFTPPDDISEVLRQRGWMAIKFTWEDGNDGRLS